MFTIHKRELGDTAPFTYMPMKEGESAVLGTVYKQVAGKLTKASATDKPKYLCLGVQRKDMLAPMVRISPDMELVTTQDAAIADTLIGSAVTIGANGATVTATTASGVFTVSATDGLINGMVAGYFE
ncbi:MAG: hypothetical protein RR573_02890 [Oscillospiraceae bacterium]